MASTTNSNGDPEEYEEYCDCTSLLTNSEESACRELFLLIDSDNSGAVEPDELGRLLGAMADAKQQMKVMDTNKDGRVSVKEWLFYLNTKKKDKGEKRFSSLLLFLRKRVNEEKGGN